MGLDSYAVDIKAFLAVVRPFVLATKLGLFWGDTPLIGRYLHRDLAIRVAVLRGSVMPDIALFMLMGEGNTQDSVSTSSI